MRNFQRSILLGCFVLGVSSVGGAEYINPMTVAPVDGVTLMQDANTTPTAAHDAFIKNGEGHFRWSSSTDWKGDVIINSRIFYIDSGYTTGEGATTVGNPENTIFMTGENMPVIYLDTADTRILGNNLNITGTNYICMIPEGTISFWRGRDVTTTSKLTGNGTVAFQNGGLIYFNNNIQEFTGTFQVDNATLAFDTRNPGFAGTSGAKATFAFHKDTTTKGIIRFEGDSLNVAGKSQTVGGIERAVFQMGDLSSAYTYANITSTAYTIPVLLQVGGKIETGASSTYAGRITDEVGGTDGKGTFALEKVGAGTLTLTNTANTYSGGTILTEGTLVTTADTSYVTALGSGPIYFNGGSLQTNASLAVIRSNLIVQADTTSSFYGTEEFSGRISFLGVDKDHASTLTGSGTLVKKGSGTAYLHNDSSGFTGTLQVDAGKLGLGLSNHVLLGVSSKNATWNLVGGTTYFEHTQTAVEGKVGSSVYQDQLTRNWTDNFHIYSTETSDATARYVYQIGTLKGTSGILEKWDLAADMLVKVGGRNESSEFGGRFNGNFAVEKVGTGTLTLTGSGNRFDGGLFISEGMLQFDGSTASNLIVNAGGTLSGKGTVTGTLRLNEGATLLANLATGRLKVTGISYEDTWKMILTDDGLVDYDPYFVPFLDSSDTNLEMLTESIRSGLVELDLSQLSATSLVFGGFKEGSLYLVDRNYVPEPSTWLLSLLMLVGGTIWIRQKRTSLSFGRRNFMERGRI